MSANGENLFPAPKEHVSSVPPNMAIGGAAFQLSSRKVDEVMEATGVFNRFSVLMDNDVCGNNVVKVNGVKGSPGLTTVTPGNNNYKKKKKSTRRKKKKLQIEAITINTLGNCVIQNTPNPVTQTVIPRDQCVPVPLLSRHQKRKRARLRKQNNATTPQPLENSLTTPTNSGTISIPVTQTTVATKASAAAKKKRKKRKRKLGNSGTAVKDDNESLAKKMRLGPNVVQSQVTITTTSTKKKKNKKRKKKTAATVNPIITAQVNDNKANNNKVSGVVGNTSSSVASNVVNQVVGGAGQNASPKKEIRMNNQATVSIKEEENVSQKCDEPVTKKIKVNTGFRPVGISSNRPKTAAESPIFNPIYGKKSQKDEIRAGWNGKGGMKTQGEEEDAPTVIKDPFTCCYLPAFLSNPTFLDKMCEELQDLEMNNKNNDLYKVRRNMLVSLMDKKRNL